MLWSDGAPATLARWQPRRRHERIERALETAHGIVLVLGGRPRRPRRRVIPIGSEPMGHGVIADDAHHFAYVETHLGRNSYCCATLKITTGAAFRMPTKIPATGRPDR